MTLYALDEVIAELGVEDELDHVVCDCDRGLALCGMDVSDMPYDESDWDEEDPAMCVVCVDLAGWRELGCFRCRA